MKRLSPALACLWLGLSCRGAPSGLHLGPLPADWTQVRVRGGEVVYHHRGGGAIAASGACQPGRTEDVPLDVLTNHLLFGVQVVRDARDSLTLDGREARRAHVLGRLDGVPVELELVVLKKDGCTYDLQLVADPATFAARQPDFRALLGTFSAPSGPGGPRRP